jgi:hypothetical protein
MKQFIVILLLSGIAFGAQAQSAPWKELDEYHKVMAATFHPSEEGNLQPIRERSGELAAKAKTLYKSSIPTAYQKPGVKETLKLLAKESKALDKMVQRKKSDAEVTKALAALHDRFHEVMEKCHH